MAEQVSIDVRGLSCPQPMLQVSDTLKRLAAGTVEVWADCGSAQDNITRAAERAGWKVAAEERPGGVVRFLLRK
jgi:TusA-related sulfurtransferase